MPDLMNFSVTRIAAATMTVPRWTIAGQIVDSQTQQTVLQDFTGPNAVVFPTVLGNLTNGQQDTLVSHLVLELLQARFPNIF